MENIKKLNTLVEKAVSDGHESISPELMKQILQTIQSRVDMPKHAITAISKRMIMKNRKLLVNAFNLLEFLSYECQLSLYSQIATKQFLFKISGLLMNKDVDQAVKNKIMETIFCWEELFRPHEDLVPLFFQFYAGILRQQIQIPHDYVSPFRPAKLKEYKKKEQKTTYKEEKKKSAPEPTKTELKTFQQIRQKLILTNDIIDNTSPSQNVKDNDILLDMIDLMKECQKKINKTINENPNEKIMQMALAINDDIFITYRRYKDLQRNKKPQPFILTELASDVQKEHQFRKASTITSKPVKRQEVPKKQEPKKQQPRKEEAKQQKKQMNILDLDYQPEKKKPQNDSIFDLLGEPTTVTTTNMNNMPNPTEFQTNQDLLGTSSGSSSIPQPTGNGITLNLNEYKTQSDMKQYDDRKVIDKLTDLTDFSDFMKK